jgi:hypothetical protein
MFTDFPECDGHDIVVEFVCMLTKRMIVEPITKPITGEQISEGYVPRCILAI